MELLKTPPTRAAAKKMRSTAKIHYRQGPEKTLRNNNDLKTAKEKLDISQNQMNRQTAVVYATTHSEVGKIK